MGSAKAVAYPGSQQLGHAFPVRAGVEELAAATAQQSRTRGDRPRPSIGVTSTSGLSWWVAVSVVFIGILLLPGRRVGGSRRDTKEVFKLRRRLAVGQMTVAVLCS